MNRSSDEVSGAPACSRILLEGIDFPKVAMVAIAVDPDFQSNLPTSNARCEVSGLRCERPGSFPQTLADLVVGPNLPTGGKTSEKAATNYVPPNARSPRI